MHLLLARSKITALHVHGAKRAGEVWLWCEQGKCWPSIKQDNKMLPAVFEKCLCDRTSPVCTLSQNGYGGRRVKARKCTCFFPLISSKLYMCMGRAGEVVTGRAGEASVFSDAS
jgi:hypothetical protein